MKDIYERTMTYYWAVAIDGDKKVVGRSYPTQDGRIYFEIGSRFPRRDPVSNLHEFFAVKSLVCENEKELKYEIKELKKIYEKIEMSEEKYR